MNQLVFSVSDCEPLFTSRELAVQSVRLSYHKIAQTVPNALLTQVTVVFNDKRRKKIVHQIVEHVVHDCVEHL